MKRTVAVGAALLIATLLCARDTYAGGYPGRWLVPVDVAQAGSPAVPHDGAPLWAGGVNCAGGFTPGANELGARLQTSFAQITRVFGYECRQNTALPNETSQHGTGRAIDLAIPTRAGEANNELGDPVANWLVANSSRIGVQLIIWDHTIWVGRLTGTKDLPYSGPDPHVDHIHVELNRAGADGTTDYFRGPTGRQELQILSKGGATVSIAINGSDVVAVECAGGAVVRPGVDGVPPLPWVVKVTDRDTGRVRLDQRISQLPRWLVLFRDSAGVSASPISGPVPVCP